MTSYLTTIAAIYLMMGAAFTFLIVANMPIIIEGPLALAWVILIWPLVLWSYFGAGAMMFATAVYLVVAHSLYRWMI